MYMYIYVYICIYLPLQLLTQTPPLASFPTNANPPHRPLVSPFCFKTRSSVVSICISICISTPPLHPFYLLVALASHRGRIRIHPHTKSGRLFRVGVRDRF